MGLPSPILSFKPKWFSLLCLKGILTRKEMDLNAWSISRWESKMSLSSNYLGPGQGVSSHVLGLWRHCSVPKAAVFLKEKRESLAIFPGRSLRASRQVPRWKTEVSGNILSPQSLWMTFVLTQRFLVKLQTPHNCLHSDSCRQLSPLMFGHWSRTVLTVNRTVTLLMTLATWCCLATAGIIGVPVCYYWLIRDLKILEHKDLPHSPNTPALSVEYITALTTVFFTLSYEVVYGRPLFLPLGCTNGSPGLDMTQLQNQFTRETTPWTQKGLLGGWIWLTCYGKLVIEKDTLSLLHYTLPM